MRRSRLALILSLSLTSPAAAERLDFVSRLVWQNTVTHGVSGLEVSDDGSTFVAVSDRGWIFEGRILREDGRLSEVQIDSIEPIRGEDGRPNAARRVGDWSDAEGLAIAEDGTRFISFERWSRVARYPAGDTTAVWIRDHDDFFEQPQNRQLEAVAVSAEGTVYTIPEHPTDDGFPIYRLDGDTWVVSGRLPRLDRFTPVGADFGPDGRLWVLERKLSVGLFWQNRVRVMDVDSPEEAEIVWTGGRDEFWNMEGIALWQAPDGLRVLCVSDNNQDGGEPTEFVEFRVVN